MRNTKRSNASAHTTRLHDQDSVNCTTNWTSGWQWLRRFMSATPSPADDTNPPPPTPCTASIDGISVVMDKDSGNSSKSARSSGSTSGPVVGAWAEGELQATGPSAAEEHTPPAVPATHTAPKAAAQQTHAAAAKAAAPSPGRPARRKVPVPDSDPPVTAAPASASTANPAAPTPAAAPAAATVAVAAAAAAAVAAAAAPHGG